MKYLGTKESVFGGYGKMAQKVQCDSIKNNANISNK